jgi:membrane-bound lytic murein transglycosylase D
MKTMLKTTISKTVFFGQGLVLLLPVGVSMNLSGNSQNVSWSSTSSHAAFAVSDTAIGCCPEDSLLEAAHLTTEQAPTFILNRHVVKFVKDMARKEDESLEKVRRKSPSYFRTIEAIFRQYDLPAELKYLAVVESELKTTALSRVGAKGLWQLMPVTARELGLKVSGRTDERTHFYKSTIAAAKYLRYLHTQFDDWLLSSPPIMADPAPCSRPSAGQAAAISGRCRITCPWKAAFT